VSRDSQRQRLYDAEDYVRLMLDTADRIGSRTVNIHGSKIVLPIERKFADLDSVKLYIDRVLDLSQIRRAFPIRSRHEINVRFRKGSKKAHYEYPGVIAVNIPPHRQGWAMREIVVLHEVAHHLAQSGHDEMFAGAFTFLVSEIIGPEVAFLLQDSFRIHGVQWSPVRDNDSRPKEANPI
jgi:putative metallohydrolase (TIGR04338 family)